MELRDIIRYEELGEDFHEFVKSNAKADVCSLMLQKAGKSPDFPLDLAITQIRCRQTTSHKLSAFISNGNFIFPTALSAEQASNQCVSAYHAALVGKGKNVMDLTSGLGIDAFTIARNNRVTAIEIDPQKAEALRYNSKILGLSEIEVINDDCMDYLGRNPEIHADILFIDPARRDGLNRRTYGFTDCTPDILANYEMMSNAADTIMVKASPMLDISQVIKELPTAAEIHTVCVSGECKELLVICDARNNEFPSKRKIVVADLAEYRNQNEADNDDVESKAILISKWECLQDEFGQTDRYIGIEDLRTGTYLYDPNAGLHKLNASKKLCEDFEGLYKICPNTDLYWSEKAHDTFPGRRFVINSIPDKKEIKALKGCRREVATRNYVMGTDLLRKKIGLKDGGKDLFIFGFKAGTEAKPILIDCKLE